eukprot:10523080-Ditylum_brightwellii.AAC.1
MHGSLKPEVLLQVGQYFNILKDFVYMPVPTYNIGTKPTVAGFPRNPIDRDGGSVTSSVPSTTSFHGLTEQELKEKNMHIKHTITQQNV